MDSDYGHAPPETGVAYLGMLAIDSLLGMAAVLETLTDRAVGPESAEPAAQPSSRPPSAAAPLVSSGLTASCCWSPDVPCTFVERHSSQLPVDVISASEPQIQAPCTVLVRLCVPRALEGHRGIVADAEVQPCACRRVDTSSSQAECPVLQPESMSPVVLNSSSRAGLLQVNRQAVNSKSSVHLH